jgi:hypothetical protein
VNDADSFSCCLGKKRKDYPTFPAVDLINYCMAGKTRWRISTKSRLPPGGSGVLTLTPLAGQAERDILVFLQRLSQAGIGRVPMHGHCTSPWAVRASDLSSGGSLLDCFGRA